LLHFVTFFKNGKNMFIYKIVCIFSKKTRFMIKIITSFLEKFKVEYFD